MIAKHERGGGQSKPRIDYAEVNTESWDLLLGAGLSCSTAGCFGEVVVALAMGHRHR